MTLARLATRALVLCVVVSCATVGRPEPSVKEWSTRATDHFLIHSDAGELAMQLAANRLEEVYAALSSSFFGDAHVPLVEVLVFYDRTQYRALIGDSAGAFYDGIGRTGSVLVLNDRSAGGGFDNLVAHELTHRFASSLYGTLPNWLSEGLAMFFESVVVDKDRLEFGATPREGLHAFAVAGGVSFSDLLTVPPTRLYGNEANFYYNASWGLVHHLFTAQGGALRERLPTLLAAVNRAAGDPMQIRAAFHAVYPEQSPADFDAAIERNNRRIQRPTADRLLRLPFSRPGTPKLARLGGRADEQAEKEEIVSIFTALEERRMDKRDTRAVLLERRRYARAEIDLDLFNRPRYFGVGAGRMVAAHTALEADLGLSGLGVTLAPRVRQFFQIGEDGNFFLSAGAGPLLAVDAGHGAISGAITGIEKSDTPNPEAVAFCGGVGGEAAAEVRTPSHLLIRLALGGNLGWSTAGNPLRRDLSLRGALGWTF